MSGDPRVIEVFERAYRIAFDHDRAERVTDPREAFRAGLQVGLASGRLDAYRTGLPAGVAGDVDKACDAGVELGRNAARYGAPVVLDSLHAAVWLACWAPDGGQGHTRAEVAEHVATT